MQLNIAKIVLVIAIGMTNIVFADYRCCKKQSCNECSVPVTSCNSCTNVSLTQSPHFDDTLRRFRQNFIKTNRISSPQHLPYQYCCPA